jgi:hypothetical protein
LKPKSATALVGALLILAMAALPQVAEAVGG